MPGIPIANMLNKPAEYIFSIGSHHNPPEIKSPIPQLMVPDPVVLQSYGQFHLYISRIMNLIAQIAHEQKHIWTLDWHPLNNILAVAGSDKIVTVWSFKQSFTHFTIIQKITDDHTKTIRSIQFSPNGQMLCAASFDSCISVYAFTQNQYQFLTKLQGHQSQVKCISWSPDNKRIASCSRDKNIWVWQFQPTNFDFICSNVLEGHTQDIKWVKWLNNYSLVSASYDDTIKIWSADDDDFVCLQTLEGHNSIVWCVENTLDEKYLFSVSEDRSLKIWQQTNGKYHQKESLNNYHERAIYSCSINKQNDRLITGGGDNSINVLNLEQFKQNKELHTNKYKNSHASDINCVKFFPRLGNVLASCGDDNTIKIWKLQ